MKIVVDTSVIIDYLRSKTPDETLFYDLSQKHDLVISLVTVAEIYSGKSANTAKGQKIIKSIIEGMEIRIPDFELAKLAGELRMKYQLSISDAFIGVLALKLDIPLATLDTSDFNKIKNLKLSPQVSS